MVERKHQLGLPLTDEGPPKPPEPSTRIVGDRFAGQFPRELLQRHGLHYVVAEQDKSTLYRQLLPLLTSGRVRLPDDPRLIAQAVSLERRTSFGRGAGVIDLHSGLHYGAAEWARRQQAARWGLRPGDPVQW